MKKDEIRAAVLKRLVIGNAYKLNVSILSDGRLRNREVKRMKCIGIGRDIATFEGEKGMIESFQYIELYKMMIEKEEHA